MAQRNLTKCEPMNPSAPVMKAVLFTRVLSLASSCSRIGSCNPAGFDPGQPFVPKPHKRPLEAWQEQLSSLGTIPAKKFLNPRVLPGQARGIQLPSQVFGDLMHLFSYVGP